MAQALRKFGEVLPILTRPSFSGFRRPSNESTQGSGSEADFLDEEEVNRNRCKQAVRRGGHDETRSAPRTSAGERVPSRELMPPPPRPLLVSNRGGPRALQPDLFASQEVSRSLPGAPQTGLGAPQYRQSRLNPKSAPFVPASDRRQATGLSTGSSPSAFQTPTSRLGGPSRASQPRAGERLISFPAQDELQRSRAPSVLDGIPATGRRLSLPPRPRQSPGSQQGSRLSTSVISPFFQAPSRPASSVSNARHDQTGSDQGPSGRLRMSSEGRRKARR